jgi:hypothetical protein
MAVRNNKRLPVDTLSLSLLLLMSAASSVCLQPSCCPDAQGPNLLAEPAERDCAGLSNLPGAGMVQPV